MRRERSEWTPSEAPPFWRREIWQHAWSFAAEVRTMTLIAVDSAVDVPHYPYEA